MTSSPSKEFEDNNRYCIDLHLVTDKYGKETGFELLSQPEDTTAQTEKLVGHDIKSLQSETTYTDHVCVPRGKYKFTIYDNFGGICCQDGRGKYAATLDGAEVVFGGNFRKKSISHYLLVGYAPEMKDIGQEWLNEHNIRRKVFHEKHGTAYRPLLWSTELAIAASNWVDEILTLCKISRDPDLQSRGENMSVTRYRVGPSEIESPKHLLVSSIFYFQSCHMFFETETSITLLTSLHNSLNYTTSR